MDGLKIQRGYIQSIALLLGALLFMGLMQSQLRALWQVDLQQLKRTRLTELNHLFSNHYQYLSAHPTTVNMYDKRLTINPPNWPNSFIHLIDRIELVQHQPQGAPQKAIVINRCTEASVSSPAPCSEWRYLLTDDTSLRLQYRVDYSR